MVRRVNNGGTMTDISQRMAGPTGAQSALIGIVRLSDGVNRVVGLATAWMTLGTVLACFASVYTRYALDVNFIWLQEIYVWQHAAVIVLGAGYTMMTGGFVRVDVFYAQWSARKRAATDMVMTLIMLLPFLLVFMPGTWNFLVASWRSNEGSMHPGGIPDLWLLKGTLVAFCVLVGLQGLATVARGVLVLSGREEWVLADSGHAPDTSL
jgi:TRAP-type mannitol/chloroaromatic compound transport system permease small subunit